MKKKAATPKESKKPLTPGELIKKHIHDQNHVVTDEELQQVKVGVDAVDESEVKKREKELEEGIEELKEKHAPNPYDVLGNE